MERKMEHKYESAWRPFVQRLGLSLGVGLALLAALLAAGAAVCLRLDTAQAMLSLAAIPLAGGAAFVAAFLNVRRLRRQGLLMGVVAAAALYICVLVVALPLSRVRLGTNAVLLLLAMLFCGAVGGIFAANRPALGSGARKRRRKK
jgi:putative membrane protein (TIGR04086 family)